MSPFIASAVFDSHSEANRAIADLRDAGVPDNSISLIAKDGGKAMTTSAGGHVTDDGEAEGRIARGVSDDDADYYNERIHGGSTLVAVADAARLLIGRAGRPGDPACRPSGTADSPASISIDAGVRTFRDVTPGRRFRYTQGMTDFAALLLADDGGPATPLTLLTTAGFDAWLREQGERTRNFVAAQRFGARPNEVALVPGDGPADWWAVAGVEAALSPWSLAAAVGKLPAGRYRLAGACGPSALGWLLAQHRFDRYRKANGGDAGARVLLTGDVGGIGEAVRLAEATALVRDLVDTPAADMGPGELAEAVIEQGRMFGAEVAVIKGEALLDRNFPAVHAVGRAASRAPRLIDLRWGDAAHPNLTLVGKGVTFDSGGLNIKPTSGMAAMKKDMGGAAHALALARLVMQANLAVRLRLIIPAVENSISADAMRPGDVLATRAGKTIEVTNTDAEGRLVLADALALAGEEPPALLLDFATLTGAARVALGPQLPALFSNDEALAADFADAAIAAGDPLWRLPLWPGYRDMLKSSVADMVNSAEGGFAGAVTAALFLEAFVAPGTPWAHFDTFAWNPATRPGRPKGGEALGLRASWALVRQRFGRGV